MPASRKKLVTQQPRSRAALFTVPVLCLGILGSLVAWWLQRTSPETDHGLAVRDLMVAELSASTPMLQVIGAASRANTSSSRISRPRSASDGYLVTAAAALDYRSKAKMREKGPTLAEPDLAAGRPLAAWSQTQDLPSSACPTRKPRPSIFTPCCGSSRLACDFCVQPAWPAGAVWWFSAANAGVHAALEIEPPPPAHVQGVRMDN